MQSISSPPQANAEVVINENFESVLPAELYGKRQPATTGLTWAYYGGRFNGNTVSNGTVALTASNTNYIVANRSTGAVTVATSTTNWNNDTDYMRLYSVVAGASTITSYIDFRQTYGATGGGGGAVSSVNGATGVVVLELGDIDDVDASSPANGDVLTWDSGSGLWVPAAGGGGGGMSNPMTSAGDLIRGGTIGAPTRVAIGTLGQELAVVSGLPAWRNRPAFSAYASAATFLSTGVDTRVDFATEEFDIGAMFASSRFKPSVPGYYAFNASVALATAVATIVLQFYKNGTLAKRSSASGVGSWSAYSLIYLNGSTDYVECYCSQSAASQNTQIGAQFTYFQGHLVSGSI